MDSKAAVAAPAAPDQKALMAIADSACSTVIELKIDSPMMNEYFAVELIDLAATYKKIEDQRFTITRPMDAAKAATMAVFKPALDKITARMNAIKGAMLTYSQEAKRQQVAAQKLLDEAASVERKRIAAVQQQQAEVARKQSDIAASLMESGTMEGVSEALDMAEAAQQMASTLASTAMVISAPVVASNVTKIAGISYGGTWKARITDREALIKYIAAHPEYIDGWIEFKIGPLSGMAKAQRNAMQIPGVEAYEEPTITTRGRRAA